jgi:hypothetical protein
MSTPAADFFANPYASPQDAPPIVAEVASPPEKPGSLGIILGGFVLLLVGYITSVLAIADLYGLGMGPDGQPTPSPLAEVFTSPIQQWLFYVLTGSTFVAGAVMLGSQRMNPLAMVCYAMCPIAGLAFAAGWPLRAVKKFAEPVAALYLLVGSALAFTGGTQLFLLFGKSNGSFQPVLASLLALVGVALMVGAGIKFMYSGASGQAPAAQ